MSERTTGGEQPDFGPSGYLPERASKRARKIVLRAPLGSQWIVASLLAGLVVVVAGVMFLLRSGDPPAEPWTAVGRVEDLPPSAALDHLDAVLVTAGGRVRVFAGADGVAYCPASNRLEDGRQVWNLTGRGLGGAPSLDEHPTLVHDGTVYVDPTRTSPGPSPTDDAAEPAC
ncbi:hypothetical protein [Egicoccus sp. AB-alg6-2]|uniref:hypothetical protein n=1 Tax=Egicoccus sp. AB-alg6-2 TaxID=3242692 RepID=UPI00359EDACA